MKLHYKNMNINSMILFVMANLLLVSCGTYQSVYNNDGIYGDELPLKKEDKKVIVVNEQDFLKITKKTILLRV